MPVVGFASLHGSPGATALALAVAHQLPARTGRRPVLVEADQDGGTLAARFGLPGSPSLMDLAGAARVGAPSHGVDACAQSLPSGLALVAAPPVGDRVTAALRTAGAPLARFFADLADVDVVVDLGRIRATDLSNPLVTGVDCLVVVGRSAPEELVLLLSRIETLPRPVTELVLVGRRHYAAAEVAAAAGLEHVHEVPEDAKAVSVDPSASRRGQWQQAVHSLADRVARRLDAAAPRSAEGLEGAA